MITPTARERSEWSRLAQDAYRTGRNEYGNRFSVSAALYAYPIREEIFDCLQIIYRRWLTGGWSEVENPK